MRKWTRGRVQFFNKFQTEEQEKIMYDVLLGDLVDATSFLFESGIINLDQRLRWEKMPYKPAGFGELYNLLGLVNLIKS